MNHLETLSAAVRGCTLCRLSQTRKQAVPGEGPPDAEIMFIGEAPGYWEDEKGRPFVGPAGQFLEELLASIGMRRDQVFITNVLKCRPPGNRDPLPDEIAACSDYLERQIALISPRLIVTLGRYSMARFFPPTKSVRDLHGQIVNYKGIPCLAMYHPAAALRQASLKPVLMEDFKKIPKLLAKSTDQTRAEVAAEQQLSLF